MNVSKKILIFLFILLFPCLSHAEWFDSGWHVNYRGNIGDKKGGLTLIFDRGAVSGELYFDSDFKDIPVSGNIKNQRDIELESEDGRILKGKFLEKDTEHGNAPLDKEVMKGTITENGIKANFYVSLDNASAGDLKNKYSIAGFESDQNVEVFASKFKEAVLSGDKKKVSAMVSYPVMVNLKDGSTTEIQSVEAFLGVYDKIFYPQFIDSFKKAIPHNMFVKASGVMLSSDEKIFWVWLGGDKQSVKVASIFSDNEKLLMK